MISIHPIDSTATKSEEPSSMLKAGWKEPRMELLELLFVLVDFIFTCADMVNDFVKWVDRKIT